MKLTRTSSCLLGLALGLLPAQALVETHTFNSVNIDIPDGNPVGIVSVQNFSSVINNITDVDISLHILGTPDANPLAYNSDIYAYLQHSSGLSILLNRVGKTAANPFGYDGNGFNITMDDAAANGDIHLYGVVTLLDNPLTGSWVPDGRTADPNTVVDTDPRTAFLTTFNGLSANGDWTLFVADLSTGEQQRLADWSLTITGDTVPESQSVALLSLSALAVMATCARKHWRK